MSEQDVCGEYDALIVGAGFSGLYQLYHLRQAGFSTLLVDAGADLGGTWHWNRYPGARVDTHVPNYEFSFDEVWRDWRWSEKFPGWKEIRQYFQYIDEKLDLRRDIRFNTRVESAGFDSRSNRWQVVTDSGQSIDARFLLLCTGFAAKSHIPAALDPARFQGDWYHTAHWPEEDVSFAGKSVGIIGTGASGLQVIQEASKVAGSLTVFQRTPNYALPMRQRQFEEDDHNELQQILSGLHRRRMDECCNLHDHAPSGPSAKEASPDFRRAVFEQAWADGGFHFWGGTFEDVLVDSESNRMAYDFWRDKTRERVSDPRLAELLAPTEPPHPFGTTRPSLEQHYYEVYNQANVSLVDVRSNPIECITERGVKAGSEVYELDLLVLATGFDALTGGLTQIDIRGVEGISLQEKWQDGVKNYLGNSVAGFPNMFFIYGPLSPAALCTGPVCAELQGAWVVDCLRYLRAQQLDCIEATIDAEQDWVRRVAENGDATLFPQANSWYMGANVEGKPRQFLCYYQVEDYVTQCRQVAGDDYRGFRLR